MASLAHPLGVAMGRRYFVGRHRGADHAAQEAWMRVPYDGYVPFQSVKDAVAAWSSDVAAGGGARL